MNVKKLKKNEILLLILYLSVMVGFSVAGENRESELLNDHSLKLNGYTQVRYTYWEKDPDGFRIRRARVSLKGEILKNIDYKLQIDAVKTDVLLDAQIGLNFSRHFSLALGQFKVPFSLENLTSSSSLDTINRSQTVEKLCPGRDIGAQGRDVGITVDGKFSWVACVLGIFNGSGINQTDINKKKDIVGRLVLYPVSFLTLGLSYYRGKHSPSSEAPLIRRNRTGLEMVFINGQLSVRGEYIFASDGPTEKKGWYVQGGYDLIPEKIQTIFKYDSFDKNTEFRGDRLDVMTFGLNWFFSEKTKFQINYEHHNEESNKTSGDALLVQFQAGF